MKKIRYLVMFLFVMLLTGCTGYDMSMNINKNKSMDLSISIMSSSKGELDDYLDSLRSKYEDNGFNIVEFTSDSNYGIRISKHYDNIDNNSFAERSEEFDLLYLYDNEFDSVLETKIFNVDKGFVTNRYAANFYVDLSNKELNLSNVNITFTVILPKGSVSNNATNVSEDGNTLVWNITNNGKNDIDFVFELNSYDTIYLIIAFIIAIFLVFAIISALLSKSGDISSNDIDNDLDLLSNNKYNNKSMYSNTKEVNTKGSNVYSNYMNNKKEESKKDVELVKFNDENKNEEKIDDLLKNVSVLGGNTNNSGNVNLGNNITDSGNDIFDDGIVNSTNNNVINGNTINTNVSGNNNMNSINTNDDNINLNSSVININNNDSIVDNFNYEEEVKEEENTYDNVSLDPSIIRVNNKEVVVTKENKEDE